MALVHSHAMEDAQRVLSLVSTMQERINQAYALLKATGVAINEESARSAFWSLDDLAQEAHRVILAVLDDQDARKAKAH